MAAAKKKTSGLFSTLLLTAIVGAPLFFAPRFVRGFAALAWVDYYASLPSVPRPRRAIARTLVARVESASANLAPLPQASGAAIKALEIGQRIENAASDRAAALVIYQGVRAACVAASGRAVTGSGFAVVEARAAALEDAARKASQE